MSTRIFITGTGCISALGTDAPTSFQAICEGTSGAGAIRQLSTQHRGKLPLCEVPYSNAALAALLPDLSDKRRYSRTSLLGLLAAREAWQQAGSPNLDTGKTGVFSGNTVGGMDLTEHFYADFLEDARQGEVEVLQTHECGESTERLADYLHATGMVSTISTACSSAANAIMLGARLLKSGRINRALVGGIDALTKFTVNGFNVLQILDHDLSQPFDETRRGLNLGEGAGFLMLETAATAPPERRLAELVGYANSNDAFHQTASSPDGKGAYLAMKGALKRANIEAQAIDYINVHGTGTDNNDLSEGKAIQQLFGATIPVFSSTKAATGHTLGAAGGIEAVLSVWALREQVIYPNLRFQTPIEALGKAFTPVTKTQTQALQYVLSNSFGFGGNTSSLIFKAV
jgi:3-oxoacyl-[acyl-carrier-protein] synthase-1